MISDSSTLQLIQGSFPGQLLLVERTYREDPSFRDLCEDYRKCAGTLDRWKHLVADEAPQRVHEYTQLLLELGWEIQTWLEAEQSRSPQPLEESP